MTVASLLGSVGEGLEKAGKAAVPVLQRTAEVVSGDAPKIDEEDRRRAEKLEDEQINAKAQILENQLATAVRHGTLTGEQQQQYANAISNLYNKPRHGQVLMEKLRQAVHPNGAYAQAAQPSLPNATPEGGTASADDRSKEQAEARKLADVLKEIDERGKVAAANHKPAGKSPPVAGNHLPPDALGPDGQPISELDRNAGKSFVEYNGAWYAAPKAKPVFKTVKGHAVLVDGQSGSILRDLGPVAGAKITSRQQFQPDDNGQMGRVTLYSVTAPTGEKIDVEPDMSMLGEGDGGKAAGEKPKTPAKKVNPGSILPKTGARPLASNEVPGFSNLANKKIETTQDRQVLESGKQIISAVDDLLPILEKRKDQGGMWDAAKQYAQFEAYKHGLPPSDPDLTKIFENSALLGVVGASIWSRIGRSRYTFEVIQQHLPKPTDTPKLMYDKVKWLRDNVVPAAQEAIAHPQPDSGDNAVDKFLKNF